MGDGVNLIVPEKTRVHGSTTLTMTCLRLSLCMIVTLSVVEGCTPSSRASPELAEGRVERTMG
jgi:hypothetical protein